MLLLYYYYIIIMLLLWYYEDIIIYWHSCFFSYFIFSLCNVGKFQFFLRVFAKKIKNDTGERKKG